MGFAKLLLRDREGLIDEDSPWFEGLFDAGYERPVQIVKDKNTTVAIIRQRVHPFLLQIHVPHDKGDPLLCR